MMDKRAVLEAIKDDASTLIVAIVETSVFGVKAYHCRCLLCGWQSKRRDREKQAVEIAKRHKCKELSR